MNNIDHLDHFENIFGQQVISHTFGLGRVVGTQVMGEDKRFFVIQSEEKNVKIFVPEHEKQSFRILSHKDEKIQ